MLRSARPNEIFQDSQKPDPEKEKEFKENMQSENLEKHDRFAMFVSAFLVIILPCLLILCGICFVAMLLFGVI